MNFPFTYKAIELPAYNLNTLRAILSLRVVEKTIENLGQNSLLIKMKAAPCNPSDIAFMQGTYNIVKAVPAVPGFEGTGVVVAVGKEIDSQLWIGKSVACFSQASGDGTWAEYIETTPAHTLLLDEKLSTEQGACFFINPFTAWGLFESALRSKTTAIIVNAAGSRVADYLLVLAQRHKIKTIGIVRKPQTALTLKQKGWDEVIVSSAEGFQEELQRIVTALNVKIAFDAVGGEATGLLSNCMPAAAEIIVYGGLSGKTIGEINPLQLIFNNLTIKGFNLNDWFRNVDLMKLKEIQKELTSMIYTSQVQCPVTMHVGMHDLLQGLKHYLGSMSEGKMLIKF